MSYAASPPLKWFDRLTMSRGDSSHCRSEPFGYAQGKLREESKASDHSAFKSTQRGPTDSMCRTRVSFVRMQTQHSHNGFGFFVASLLRMTAAARLCHSERSEESRAVRPLSVQVYPSRANRFYVQDTSLVCQDANVAVAQWLGILRRFTPQNDSRRAPLSF